MKNILMACAAIALLVSAGSVAYYFVVFLPQHQVQSQQDISAIRAAVAPTAQEQAQQQAAAQQEMTQLQSKLDAYQRCMFDTATKGSDYIKEQCPSSFTNMTDYWKCSAKVQQTVYYKEHFTCSF